MSTTTITIAGIPCALPDYFQPIDPAPGDPEGFVVLGARSEMATCVTLLYEVARGEVMPRDERVIVDALHEVLEDTQGLVEVGCGELGRFGYVYTIVKSLREEGGLPMGVSYILSAELFGPGERGGVGERVAHAQGLFEEDGVTGVRDSVVFGLRGTDAVPADEPWARDPYDPTYERGALANLSEDARFDELFPAHPLSMARETARALIDGAGA